MVEVLITVAIVSLIATQSVPNFIQARRGADVARVASDLRTFADGFRMYDLIEGQFPQDTHIVLPPGMENYVNEGSWNKEVWGGNYNWEGPSWGEGGSYDYAGISLTDIDASVEILTKLDDVIDDGDLTTGSFRQTPNGRYTYIIQE